MKRFLKIVFIVICAFFAFNFAKDNCNNPTLAYSAKSETIVFNNCQKQYAIVQNNNIKISNPNKRQDFGFGIVNVNFADNLINKFHLKNALNNYLVYNFSKNLGQEINIRAP